MDSSLKTRIEEALRAIGHTCASITAVTPCHGGSINVASRLTLADGARYFLKTNTTPLPGMFVLEHQALELMRGAGPLKIPAPVFSSADFLITEWHDFGTPAANWQEEMGRGLALLHQSRRHDQYGFQSDNYLGLSRQINQWQPTWLEFWLEQRLGQQLRLLAQQTGSGDRLVRLLQSLSGKLESYLGNISEAPVLLHGDLWSGNAAADISGKPLIFDPACYYGHREAEFGMMRMFGGFGPCCEAAYAEVWPLEPGSEERIVLYGLYHQLNHLLLFGASYYQQSVDTIKALL